MDHAAIGPGCRAGRRHAGRAGVRRHRYAESWGFGPKGTFFSNTAARHFNLKAENYLEIGWRMGQAAVDNDFTGSEIVPEPASLALLCLGGLALLRRRWR